MSPILNLPDEVSLNILCFLDEKSLGRCVKTCKKWKIIGDDPILIKLRNPKVINSESDLISKIQKFCDTIPLNTYESSIRRVAKFTCLFPLETDIEHYKTQISITIQPSGLKKVPLKDKDIVIEEKWIFANKYQKKEKLIHFNLSLRPFSANDPNQSVYVTEKIRLSMCLPKYQAREENDRCVLEKRTIKILRARLERRFIKPSGLQLEHKIYLVYMLAVITFGLYNIYNNHFK